MKFYTFGVEGKPVILLLPGTCCHWKLNFGGHICAAYGCSLGGSFVGLLVQRKRIRIDHAILGSSDLDQDAVWKAKLKCKISVSLLHKIVSTGQYPKFLQGLMERSGHLTGISLWQCSVLAMVDCPS